MNALITATIGKGKAVHAMRTTGGLKGATLCVTNDYDLSRGLPVECAAEAFTCKKCLKVLAGIVAAAEVEAHAMNAAA
jgi:hypothetical protein